ncbi:hypothetical protein CDD80_6946 [Ophiocordyceps camponoti-rufipedis]|uniref:Uncharacterized protein n=1 Tax=Ophiocordyceps camponoti-rufipedis TaxID=2004952 RepID=A0A2C5XRR4_9HYPO|nr:hypothetical protein CDD80_6946 [Ophiocordyceps camponoti-rufipedis]
MADARSLLRQQRAARRIQHPHAAYSEAGKLLCTLCRQQVKAEGLWEKHLLSDGHKERVLRVREGEEKDVVVVVAAATATASNPTLKRRLDQSDALDDNEDDQDNHPAEDTLRRKRSKMDVVSPVDALRSSVASPPSLTRRHSTTPSQGVELQIPSRPATPSHRDTPSSTASGAAAPRRRAGSNLTPTAAPQVDESEWAAFEADVAVDAAQYDQDAVISAPAMTADESAAAAAAAASGNLNNEGKTKADADIEDEREEAARAMEDELQDMHELEERVKRLKEKRDALRKRSDSQAKDQPAPDRPMHEHGAGTDDDGSRRGDVVSQSNGTLEEDDDEDDDDDDDDWDGFRFHNS